MTMWIAVIGVGLGSFALRVLPLFVLGRIDLGPAAEERIGRAGLAAIAALIALSAQSTAASAHPAPVLAGLTVGVALAVRRASMLSIVLAGGAMYAAVRLGIGLLD